MKGKRRPKSRNKTSAKERRRQRQANADNYVDRLRKRIDSMMECENAWASAVGLDPAYLERRAMVQGWDTPMDMRQKVVDKILMLIMHPRVDAETKVKCFRALVIAQQKQWEQDHPELAGKAKGNGTVVVNQQKVELNLDELRKLPTDELAKVYQQALSEGFKEIPNGKEEAKEGGFSDSKNTNLCRVQEDSNSGSPGKGQPSVPTSSSSLPELPLV